MTTWTDDKVWLSFNLCTPKAVIFQYTRTVRTLIMEHQIFNKCGNTYYTIQEISTKKKEEKDIQWNKRTLLQSVLSRNYLDILEVRLCKKEKKESLSQARENEKQMAAKLLLSSRKLIADL